MAFRQGRSGNPESRWHFARIVREMPNRVGVSPGAFGESRIALAFRQGRSGNPESCWRRAMAKSQFRRLDNKQGEPPFAMFRRCFRKSERKDRRPAQGDPLWVQAISEASKTPRSRLVTPCTPCGCQRFPESLSLFWIAGTLPGSVGLRRAIEASSLRFRRLANG